MKNEFNQKPVVLILIPALLCFGVLLFAVITFALGVLTETELVPDPDTSFTNMLSWIHALFALAMIVISHFVYSKMITRFQKPDLTQFVRASIVKFALLEAGALFGLVVVITATFSGILPLMKIYYLNYLSTVYMLFEFLRFLPVLRKVHAQVS